MKKIEEIKSCDGHVFYVRKEFIRKCPEYWDYAAYDLINTYNMLYYIATREEMFADKLEDLLND